MQGIKLFPVFGVLILALPAIQADELDQVKAQFDNWRSGSTVRGLVYPDKNCVRLLYYELGKGSVAVSGATTIHSFPVKCLFRGETEVWIVCEGSVSVNSTTKEESRSDLSIKWQTPLEVDKTKPATDAKATQSEGRPEKTKYEVSDKQDVSYDRVIRIVFNVNVDEKVCQDKARLTTICEELIDTQRKAGACNAIGFRFFAAGSARKFALATADWAPDGDWAKADEVKAGDYARHKLEVREATPLPKSQSPDLPETLRRKIYRDLQLLIENPEMDGDRAVGITAKKYGISVETVDMINVEGNRRDWPVK